MLRAGTGLSTRRDPREAAREACRRALATLAGPAGPAGSSGAPRPGGALLLASGEHAEAAPDLLAVAEETLGTRALAGASVRALWAPGRETAPEGSAAVGVAVLAGVALEPFLLRDLAGSEARAGSELTRRLVASGGPPGPGDLVLLLPDADALALGPLAQGLAGPLAPAGVAGLGAAEGPGGTPLQWCGREVATGALAGLVVRGARAPRLMTAAAFRPVIEPVKVSRGRGHWVLGLDGRPALDVFREVAREPLARDLRRAAEHVVVVLPRGSGRLERGEFVPHRVVGFDPRRRAFAVPFRVGKGGAGELALAVRDPGWARDRLVEGLARIAAGPPPALALWLSCPARAEALLGLEGLEAGYVEASLGAAPLLGALGAAPLLGALGPVQIGPVAGRPEALVHAGVGIGLPA